MVLNIFQVVTLGVLVIITPDQEIHKLRYVGWYPEVFEPDFEGK
jgi:hypothetical protein